MKKPAVLLRLLCLYLLLCVPVCSVAMEIALVLSQPDGIHQRLAASLLNASTGSSARIRVVSDPPDTLAASALESADLIISTGKAAAEAALSVSDKMVFAALVNTRQLTDLQTKYGQQRVSGIVLDQPVERHIRLIRAALPQSRCVSMLFGPETLQFKAAMQEASATSGLQLNSRDLSSTDELLPALLKTLENCDALIALPDPVTSTPTTARSVLLTSYRLGKPVFAYSRAFVNAGALAAVFSNPEDLGRDLADWINTLAADGAALTLPPARAPRYFEVAVNRQVAKALSLRLPSDLELLLQLRTEETP